MTDKGEVLRVILLFGMILLGCVGCLPGAALNVDSAIPTEPTATVAPPADTPVPSFVWSPIPDIDATMGAVLSAEPPLEANVVWTATPGWLTPPTLSFTPSDTPTATILFDTPKPGQEQGVRGVVWYGGGPVNEDGTPASPGHAGGVRVFLLDSATRELVGETISSSTAGSFGSYEIELLPGRYDVCIHNFSDICTPGIIVRAGIYTHVELMIPE